MKRASEAIARRDRVLLAALYLLTLASFPYAALIVDSGRDLAWGWSIAQGQAWPLYGPSLNGLWQLGPVWYYLLALLLTLGGSIGAVALGIGALAALKVPLAYALGRRWRDASLGLACAAAVALPGWNTLGQLVLSHTSLVEATVVATLWLSLWAWQQRSAAASLGAALMFALALHAHPTALVAAPALICAGLRVARARGLLWLPLMLLAFLLPLLPAVWAEARAGWPQFGPSTDYLAGADYLARVQRLPALLWGLSAGGIGFVGDFLLSRWPAPAAAAAGLLALLYLAAAAALASTLRRGRGHAVVLGFAALAWLLIALSRDSTPAWMVYACAPLHAALLALGWNALWPAARARWGARVLAGLAIMLAFALLLDRVATGRSGVQEFPSAALADIAQPLQHDPPMRFWLPAFGHDAALREACAEHGEVAIHAELATALHFGQGVAAALHCADPPPVRLGGVATRQVAGVPRALAERLGLRGRDTVWGYRLVTPAAVLHPARGQPMQPHTEYLMDAYRARAAATQPATIALDTPCRGRDLLAATNLLPGLNAPFELAANAGAALPELVGESLASRYFACPASGRFALRLRVLDPQAMDVVLLRRD